MRIVLDPGQGAKAGAPDEAAKNLGVATLAAAAIRLATGDQVQVSLTRWDERPLPREAGVAILTQADVAVRVEHGAYEVVMFTSQPAGVSALAALVAGALRREVQPGCRVRLDYHRRLFREVPHLIVVSLPDGAASQRAAKAIASAVAAHVASLAIPR